ncbi:MAG: DUF2298 domain-containing protein [Chloroflexota bacterium]|nr:DUF2298 domain-containing protein [Chloroflexota bacterium]
MADALRWLLVLELAALSALPLCGLVFRALPDRGYTLSKPFGWLLAAWISWLLAATGPAPSSVTTDGYAVLAVGTVSFLALLWHQGGYLRAWVTYFREHWRYVVLVELVFVAGFLGFALLRSYVPEIYGTEKPMEYMYLQTLYASRVLPPPDLWLSGHRVNYYYFGFFSHVFLGRLSGVPPATAFNLALCTVWSAAIVAFGGTAYGAARARCCSPFVSGTAALLAVWLVFVASNPAGALEALRALRGQAQFSWWNPSRVVYDMIPGRGGPQETINEFPAFSFLLGDLHPHVMAMPAFALGLATSLSVVLSAGRPRSHLAGTVLFGGILCGWLWMTNTWDVPVIAALILTAAWLVTTTCAGGWRALKPTRYRLLLVGLLVSAAGAACLPFLLHYRAPVDRGAPMPEELARLPVVNVIGRYLGFVWWERTSLGELLLVWGLHVAILLLALGYLARRARPLLLPLAVVTVVAAGAALLLGAPVLLLLPVAGLAACIAAREDDPARRWACLLAAAGLTLVAMAELVYLRDVFENRMNTVFKFYFQAWQILGLACSVLVVSTVGRVRLPATRSLGTIGMSLALAVALLLSTLYSVQGVRDRTSGERLGLDGAQFLTDADTGASEAARWLREHAPSDAVVLEATGDPYSLYARVSTFAGLPTVLGWENHERQWHTGQPAVLAELGTRRSDVHRLYSSLPEAEQRRLLRKYRVRFVFYGSLERASQEAQHLPVFDPFAGRLQEVGRWGQSVLYRVA